MARIKTYPDDPTINPGDRIIGTDVIDGSTKNFAVDSLTAYLEETITAAVDPNDIVSAVFTKSGNTVTLTLTRTSGNPFVANFQAAEGDGAIHTGAQDPVVAEISGLAGDFYFQVDNTSDPIIFNVYGPLTVNTADGGFSAWSAVGPLNLLGAQGEVGDQGDQGISIDAITSDTPTLGLPTTVTVSLADPSGDTTPIDQTFMVQPGATGGKGDRGDQGFQGVSIDDDNYVAPTNTVLGTPTTVTIPLEDPSGLTTPTPITFAIPSGIQGEEGDAGHTLVISDFQQGTDTTPTTFDLITNEGQPNQITQPFSISPGVQGETGDGWTSVTYAPLTGFLTFASDDGLEFTTPDIRGGQGIQGFGYTGATYDPATGFVTFASATPALELTTSDIRGAQGEQGELENQRDNSDFFFWEGTLAQYNAIGAGNYRDDFVYNVTDDFVEGALIANPEDRVVANPSDPSTANLDRIRVDDVIYALSATPQLTEAEVRAFADQDYVRSVQNPPIPNTDTQLTQTEVRAFETPNVDTQLTEAEVRAFADQEYVRSVQDPNTDTQLTQAQVQGFQLQPIPNTDTQLTQAEVRAFETPNVDTNTQLTEAQVRSFADQAYVRSVQNPNTDTQLTQAQVRAFETPNVNTNTQLTEAQVRAFADQAYVRSVQDAPIANTDTQLTQAQVRGFADQAYVRSVQNAPIANTDTQLTASTILAVLNGASGEIDGDLLNNAVDANEVIRNTTGFTAEYNALYVLDTITTGGGADQVVTLPAITAGTDGQKVTLTNYNGGDTSIANWALTSQSANISAGLRHGELLANTQTYLVDHRDSSTITLTAFFNGGSPLWILVDDERTADAIINDNSQFHPTRVWTGSLAQYEVLPTPRDAFTLFFTNDT